MDAAGVLPKKEKCTSESAIVSHCESHSRPMTNCMPLLFIIRSMYVLYVLVFQIIDALEQDEQAQKQKLAYKVEQIILNMSIES